MARSRVTSSSTWLRGVAQVFAAQGVDTAALFRDAGIDMARLKQPHERFSSEEINRMWSLAVAASGLPALGLDRQLAGRHIDFDIAAHSMWPGPTLRHGLESLSRYLALLGDSAEFRVQPEAAGAAWLELAHGGDGKAPRQRVEFGMLTLLLLCRRVTRRQLRATAVEFIFPEPADYHSYLMAFASPLRFGQAANRLLLAGEDLALPLAISGRSVFAVHEQAIEERLARRPRARTSWRAAEEIVRRLHLGPPRARDIARALDLPESELAAKLLSERTTYEALLEDVRQDLARRYLAEPDFSLARIPALLGFATAGEFNAACRRWFGSPAAAWRHLVTGSAADADQDGLK